MFTNNLIKQTIDLYNQTENDAYENPVLQEHIDLIKSSNYNDNILNIIQQNNKIKLFLELLNIIGGSDDFNYFKLLFDNSTEKELEKIFNICCYIRDKDIINLLVTNYKIKPNQNQLELYMNEADDDLTEILEFCLSNGLVLKNKHLHKLLEIENDEINKILKKYNYSWNE